MAENNYLTPVYTKVNCRWKQVKNYEKDILLFYTFSKITPASGSDLSNYVVFPQIIFIVCSLNYLN